MHSLVDEIGCWAWCAEARFDGRPALFLDRDGVIVQETEYLGRPEDVAMIPAAAATVGAFNRAGVPVVVVTNQSGIARGLFSWTDFVAVQAEIDRRLTAVGAHVDAVFACAYHPAGSNALDVADHPWRKPRPGMIIEAAARLGLDLARSYIVGDKAGDLEAGRAGGLAGGLHVASGHGVGAERTGALKLGTAQFEVMVGDHLGAAIGLLPRLTTPFSS